MQDKESIFNKTPSQLCDILLRLCSKLSTANEVNAKARANYEAYKDQESNYLSVLMEMFEGSNAECQRRAFATEKWKVFKAEMGKLRMDFYLANSKLDTIRTKIDALRTVISTKKEEFKNLG